MRLGTALPFEQVPEHLAFLIGIHVSVDTVRRLTEQAGAAQAAIEERTLLQLERDLPAVPVGPAEQQVSADGAMVPLLHGEWAEARTVAIGTLDRETGKETPHARDITSFSRLCSAHDFIRQAALPCYARCLAQSQTVVAVIDGAPWLQEFLDAHCPHAVRILDYPHAVAYLARAAQAAFGPGTRETAAWLETWAFHLKAGDPDAVLTAIRRLPMPDADAEETRTQVLRYLTTRQGQITYAAFQEAGYPIGSGMVESANKLVVEARLKGSGMHWQRRNVTPMLALRGIACSGQWEQAWPRIWQELARQAAETRQYRREERRAIREQSQEAVARVSAPPPSCTRRQRTVIDGHPTPQHPWKAGYDPRLIAHAAAKP